MLMRNLAEYVMRGRKQAIIVALIFTMVPLFGWIADVIMALVTLRKGAKEGGLVLLWVMLPAIVLAVVGGYQQLWLYDIVGGSLLTYVLAIVLRYTNAWTIVLQVSAVIGVFAVLIAHIVEPTLTQVWLVNIVNYLDTTKQQFTLSIQSADLRQIAVQLAKIATGLQVMLLLLMDLFNLFFARWWQSLLYHPEGLATELRSIRLGLFSVGLLVLVVLGSLVGVAPAIDCLPVVMMPFILAALSLMHGLIIYTKVSKLWLIIFYCALVLLFPYMAVLLVMIALADCWYNFRRRFQISNLS